MTEAAKTAVQTLAAAFPGADVQLFDYDRSVGVALAGRAWKGDWLGGFDIADQHHVSRLVATIRSQV